AYLRGRMGVVRAVAGDLADVAPVRRSLRRSRGAPRRMDGARAEDARVRRRTGRHRLRSGHRVQVVIGTDRLVAGLADGPARRQSRVVLSRTDHDDAAADWRAASKVHGHDCLFQGEGRRMRRILFACVVVPVALVAAPSSAPTIEQFLAPGYPTEIVSAK